MIKAIVIGYHSKRDTYGNVYWAFAWTDTETRHQAHGKICGGESNLMVAIRHMDLGDVFTVTKQLGVRDFNRLTKDWPHAGCTPDEIAACIRSQL